MKMRIEIQKHTLGISFVGCVFMVFCGLLMAACAGKKKDHAVPVMEVAVQPLELQNFFGEQRFAAFLEGQKAVEIRPKISALITKLYVDEGDTVKRGQLLFTLETQTLTQDADAAKYAVEIAQVEVDRLSYLVDEDVISPVQLATAMGNLESAKAKYKSIQANIGYSRIESPVDGLVGLLPFKEGTLASPTMSAPMTTVSDIENIRAYFSLNEKQLLHFIRSQNNGLNPEKMGDINLILPDNSRYENVGKVEIINGQVNAATGSVTIRAVFPNPKKILRHGGSGTVVIPMKMQNVFIIPQKATFSVQDKQFVYVVNKDNTITAKEIHVINEQAPVYVLQEGEGLNQGDKIVVENVFKLKEGMTIKPLTAPAK